MAAAMLLPPPHAPLLLSHAHLSCMPPAGSQGSSRQGGAPKCADGAAAAEQHAATRPAAEAAAQPAAPAAACVQACAGRVLPVPGQRAGGSGLAAGQPP
jgi:hypothetical protein